MVPQGGQEGGELWLSHSLFPTVLSKLFYNSKNTHESFCVVIKPYLIDTVGNLAPDMSKMC